MMLLASAFSFLVLYVAMNRFPYSLYTMVGMRRARTEFDPKLGEVYHHWRDCQRHWFVRSELHLWRDGKLNFGDLIDSLKGTTSHSALLMPGLVMACSVRSSWRPSRSCLGARCLRNRVFPGRDVLASVSKLAGIAFLFTLVYMVKPYLPEFETVIGTSRS